MKLKNQTWLGLTLIIGMLIVGTLFSQTDVVAKTKSKAKAKVKVITVTKINQQTAKKVHKQLMRGKKFKLRTKGNLKTFHKKAEKLMDKVAKCSEYRFDFYQIMLSGGSAHIEGYVKTKGGYAYCAISPRDCQEYVYGIKFAERRHKLFMDYVDKAIPKLEHIRNVAADDSQETRIQLTSGFIPRGANPKEIISQKDIPTKLDEIIVSLRELSKYLHKTKFYKLSEAMRARIMLTVGSNKWCEPAMRYTLDGSYTTFKALYKNKAYGKCANFARVNCKTCAVFNIGD